MSPVFLQLDLDRKFQLQDIMMDFKVCFLGMAVAKREGTLGRVGLGSWGAQSPCLFRLVVMAPHAAYLPQVGAALNPEPMSRSQQRYCFRKIRGISRPPVSLYLSAAPTLGPSN